MELLEIISDTTILREISKEVSLPLSSENEKLLLSMIEYLKLSQDESFAEKHNIRSGVGLAAIQLGIKKRMFVIYLENEEEITKYALVNPKIVSHSVKETYLQSGEGCLSVPEDVPGYVYRPNKVTVKAYDLFSKKEITIVARGYLAILLQHELDHLNGILYYDRINQDNPFIEKEGSIVI